MNQEEKAHYDIKMTKAFEKGQYDSFRGRPMEKPKNYDMSQTRRYIEGYHSMQDRRNHG